MQQKGVKQQYINVGFNASLSLFIQRLNLVDSWNGRKWEVSALFSSRKQVCIWPMVEFEL